MLLAVMQRKLFHIHRSRLDPSDLKWSRWTRAGMEEPGHQLQLAFQIKCKKFLIKFKSNGTKCCYISMGGNPTRSKFVYGNLIYM